MHRFFRRNEEERKFSIDMKHTGNRSSAPLEVYDVITLMAITVFSIYKNGDSFESKSTLGTTIRKEQVHQLRYIAVLGIELLAS